MSSPLLSSGYRNYYRCISFSSLSYHGLPSFPSSLLGDPLSSSVTTSSIVTGSVSFPYSSSTSSAWFRTQQTTFYSTFSSSRNHTVSPLPIPRIANHRSLATSSSISSSSSSVSSSTSSSSSPPSSSSSSMIVFNTQMKLQQRNRAAIRPDSTDYDYLRDEIANRLVDRLYDINRSSFPVTVDLGANTGNLYKALVKNGTIERIQTLHMIDSSPFMLYRDRKEWEPYIPSSSSSSSSSPPSSASSSSSLRIIPHVQSLEHQPLPFPDRSVDLVLSSCSLHWINDIPKVLSEVKRILKPDGIFLCALLGGDTLHELKESFYHADMRLYNGISPHISPMIGIADAGNLITNAGFGIPTIDTDTFTIEYPSPYALYRHLQGMGENNSALGIRSGIRKALFTLTADIYASTYGRPSSSPMNSSNVLSGTGEASSSSSSSSSSPTVVPGSGQTTPVPATYQIIYMIGWAPAPTQPLPKARGSVPKGFGMRKTSPSGGKDGPTKE